MKFPLFGKSSRFTGVLSATFVGVVVIFLDLYLDLDLFGLLIASIARFHENDYEIDEVILLMAFTSVGVVFDLIRFKVELKQRDELISDRLHTVQLTMTSVNDIVNNLLTNMQFIQFKAEQGAILNPEEIEILDNQIREAAEKIQKIHELEEILDRDLGQGISGLQFEAKRGNGQPT